MSSLKIHTDESAGMTKIQQLVHGITEAISNGVLKAGDILPSVNQLSNDSGFSRDTVFKAYNILKERSIIESAPQKGYYVAGESFKVFMLLDDFSAFKEQLYNSFRANLPDNYSVDLMFHHYNPNLFEQLVQNSLGRYSMYVVMNIDNTSFHPILEKIDSNKLLLLDMGQPDELSNNYIIQDFSQSVLECLNEGKDLIAKYDEMVLVFPEVTPHPPEIISSVKIFCKKQGVVFSLRRQLKHADISPGRLYFVIRDVDLVQIVKTARQKDLALGKDIGVIAYNDTPMKEVVGEGITVISTDFKQMGKMAAGFISSKKKVQEVLATELILRRSL